MSATQAVSAFSTRSISTATSPGAAPLQVVCAWPQSSNYGPGSRILYYILVAACVTFRKTEWLRNTCLAAVLILPAISAIQGIVLASFHVNGAVDLDLYGCFQFCAIGILAAPLTVRLSRTYFYNPGRNIIFLWTVLILMGLLALCVEFYRVTPTDCSFNNTGTPLLSNAAKFPYEQANCTLTCSEKEGPFSPMRGGAAANVYVIPVPRILTFNAAMLLATGFCIPAILSLVFTWDKILEINWKRRRHVEQLDDRIEGANITVREMRGINDVVRVFLSVIEIPLFGGIILTIIGVGEANFFSPQMRYMTEPMASIGQWSPIAGTVLAALGSLYLLWSTADDSDTLSKKHGEEYAQSGSSLRGRSSERDLSPGNLSAMHHAPSNSRSSNALGIWSDSPRNHELVPTITHPEAETVSHEANSRDRQSTSDQQDDQPTAGRYAVRKFLTSVGNRLGDVAHERLDTQGQSSEQTQGYPETPGENLRNPDLEDTKRAYSEGRSSPSPSQGSPFPEISPSRVPKRRDTLEIPKEVRVHRRSS